MGFRTVVVTQHSKVSYRMNQIIIQTDDDVFQIPISDIDVLLIGTTQAVITGHAVMRLVQESVKLIFCDDKGFPVGEMNGYYTNQNRNVNIELQIKWNDLRKKNLWQKITQIKVTHQMRLLQEKRLNDLGFSELIGEVELGDETNREAVAARMYFPRLFGSDFTRKNESHTTNAKLNFGYSILLSAVTREIQSYGYLTEIGIHHDSIANVFNLSSDLMEPFRPLIDRIVKQNEHVEFGREVKLALISALNESIRINNHESQLITALSEYVRQALDYLSEKTEHLPEWEMEL